MKAAFVILAGLILAFFAFSAVRPVKNEKKKVVYYYPSANVYHDQSEEDYYFYHAEQKEWIATKKISGEQESSLGDKIPVPVTDPVWKNNYQDRLVFSVKLYARSSDLQKKFRDDSLKLILQQRPVIASFPSRDSLPPSQEKPKKGLKKFFDKLFGKSDRE